MLVMDECVLAVAALPVVVPDVLVPHHCFRYHPPCPIRTHDPDTVDEAVEARPPPSKTGHGPRSAFIKRSRFTTWVCKNSLSLENEM